MAKKKELQKGVTQEALSFVKREYQLILDNQNLSPVKAFRKKANEIQDISISGKTLKKVFEGIHVHVDTIKGIIEGLGEETIFVNGQISINEKDVHSKRVSEVDSEKV